ncbi:hypothetical protein [Streptomyces sp. NPDC102360]
MRHQDGNTRDTIFSPAWIVHHLSHFRDARVGRARGRRG